MVIFSRSAPSNSSLTNSRISSFVGGDFFAFLLSGSSSDESPESAFFSKKILDEIRHFSSTVPERIALVTSQSFSYPLLFLPSFLEIFLLIRLSSLSSLLVFWLLSFPF
jgi:hypothetical protein